MKNLYFIKSETGQAMTEFLIVFPALLLSIAIVVFFARLLVLKQRTVTAVRYASWYAGRHGDTLPDEKQIKALFFATDTEIKFTTPDASVGFAGNQLGDLGDILGSIAGLKGTGIQVRADDIPFTGTKSYASAVNFVFMDTWNDSSITGNVLKYGLWAIAVAKAFKGSSVNIDLEKPHL